MDDAVSCQVAVIGGGINGAGVALLAAAAGYRVTLIERTALGAGASSRSTKLIHGGLRYLAHGDWPLVRAALAERAWHLRAAPGLVHPVRIRIPVYRTSRRPRWQIGAGLAAYRALGGGAFRVVAPAAGSGLDGLETAGLRGVFEYTDAQTDDRALVAAVAAAARARGARLLIPAELVGGTYRGRRWRLQLRHGGTDHELDAEVLVNATGAWINTVQARLDPPLPPHPIALVRGTHLVLPGAIGRGYYLEARADRRPVFVLPWGETTLLGTTEVEHRGTADAVVPSATEIEYLRASVAAYFPHRPRDPLEQYAGLRVLPRGPGAIAARSRESQVVAADCDGRLITVIGGKLTVWRRTAAAVLDQLRVRSAPGGAVQPFDHLAPAEPTRHPTAPS